MIEVMDTVGVLTLGFAAGMTVSAGLTFRVLWGPEKVPAETGADEEREARLTPRARALPGPSVPPAGKERVA
jgi:hypothetical protein